MTIVTLSEKFTRSIGADLGAPQKTVNGRVTYDLTDDQCVELRATIAAMLSDRDAGDHANKMQAANARRSATAALKALDAAGAPKTKKRASPRKEMLAPQDRPDPKDVVDVSDLTYRTLTQAFKFFNAELFYGKLPPVMIVLHRKRGAAGYFWEGQWTSDKKVVNEIALNPEHMGRDAKEVLSTLVHEMVHHEQQCFGKPSKSGHNVEWCEWMERIGLTPKGVGNCKGKRSGRNFTHTIDEGGAFDKAATAFLARPDVDMTWAGRRTARVKKQDYSKTKHTCECGCNLWGKFNPEDPDGCLDVICGRCNTPFEPVLYV